MYQISYSSFPFHMMNFLYPNMAIAETIMNPVPPIVKSQPCGSTVSTFPSLVIGKLVDLKHEEIETNATK
jgi:hypothetical protein